MADSGEPGSALFRPGTAPDPHAEMALRHAIELLFFAYRDFTAEADAMLARYGFGRAHHRVVYFVGQNPGATVSELLSLLKITKQSLSRVLSQLMREGFIVQKGDLADRRRRRLYLTAEAKALEQRLTGRQMALLARAFAEAGAPAEAGFRAVLRAMINIEDRQRFAPSVSQDIVTIDSR